MARKVTSKAANRNDRLALAPRGKPYHFTDIATGVALGYRRNKSGNGTWVMRVADGENKLSDSYWTRAIAGAADDYNEANGIDVLSFHQAADKARELAPNANAKEARRDQPATNLDALMAYRDELAGRGGNPYNANYVIRKMPAWLSSMPVASSKETDYRKFRDGLAPALKPASIARLCKGFAAALSQAARRDDRITHKRWVEGFRGTHGEARSANHDNNATDQEIIAVVAASYDVGEAFGLFIDVAAQTGARPIQIARLRVVDLKFDPPRLVMPSSFKGDGKTPRKPAVLPITAELAARLAQAASARKMFDPLLMQAGGLPWFEGKPARACKALRSTFRRTLDALGMTFSLYGLRHSHIIRGLKAGIPMAIVAKAHDTSAAIIEQHYGACVADFSDDLLRRAMLDTAPRSNVVPLRA